MENNKTTTIEDYKRRIDLIINYVREHLDSPIDLATLAELSAFSPFHFHRITKAYLKEPIGRPSYPGLVLFKITLLQTWYNLSDYEVDDQVNDRTLGVLIGN